MNQYSKQFAIIRKLKSLVKRTGRAIRRRRLSEISEDIARKIQRSAYDLSHSPRQDTYTPPYMDIVSQLQVRDAHIFRAAAFNLIEIARQQAKYRDDIVKILKRQLKEDRIASEEKEYVQQKLNTL